MCVRVCVWVRCIHSTSGTRDATQNGRTFCLHQQLTVAAHCSRRQRAKRQEYVSVHTCRMSMLTFYCVKIVCSARRPCNNARTVCTTTVLWSIISFTLVIKQLNAKNLVLYKFIICLYMFRALCAHHEEVKIVLYSIWYHHTCRWPSGAQVERGPPDDAHIVLETCTGI